MEAILHAFFLYLSACYLLLSHLACETTTLLYECVKEAKSVHSPLKICLVSLNFTQRVKVDKSFDEIIQLNQEGVSHQLQKLSLFEWLINKADFLISLTDSKETRITVRNLADKDLLFFSTRIRLLRLKQGLSQRDLAESIEIAPSTMYKQGRREPYFPTLLNMYIKLETTPDYVLGLDEKFKSRLVEIDALLSKFLDDIKKSNRLLYTGEVSCREGWEKLLAVLVRYTREKAGRKTEPSYGIIDSQSVKTAGRAEKKE